MSNSNSNSNSSDKTFTVQGPVPDGTVGAVVDAGKVLYISYQIVAVISGGAPDVTFTLLKRNDNSAPWVEAGVSVNMTAAGLVTDFLELDLAKSEHYGIRVNVAAGTVDQLKIYFDGK